MGTELAAGSESGRSSSTTCGQTSGIVCQSCAYARNTEVNPFLARISATGIKVACSQTCLDLNFNPRVQFETMDNSHKFYEHVVEGDYSEFDEAAVNVSPVHSQTVFTTTATTTCRARQYLPFQLSPVTSPLSSSLSLPEPVTCALKRHIGCCQACSVVGFKHSGRRNLLKMSVFVVILAAMLLRTTTAATMEITAFEYQRKFHKQLDMGECAQREVAVDLGNNTFYYEEQRCTLQQRGAVTNMPRELNDSRNVVIPSADSVIAYLGLCGGEAASFLGILHSGDCVAVEIASRLVFSEKTLVRVFVGYYRKSLEILEGSIASEEGMDRYYKNKFYLKNRSYGTLEIIFVQFRFDTVRDTEEAKDVELANPLMSGYLRQIQKRIGIPKNIVVISLSTAKQTKFELKQFKNVDWERGVRYVEILELGIQKTRLQINNNVLTPHLQYQLHPFIDSPDFRLTKPVYWEKTSMLEVQLRQAVTLAKKTGKKCRANRTKLCKRVRELRRTLVATQAEIHRGRSNWVNLGTEEKDTFSSRYTTRVNSYSTLTKALAKSVREMKKKEKMEKLERKKKAQNQVPLNTEGHPQERPHPIRHSRRRARERKTLSS